MIISDEDDIQKTLGDCYDVDDLLQPPLMQAAQKMMMRTVLVVM